MPEIKHNFTKGRMNKDLDERLVPNGEYRDAMNVQVSTSEGSDVGTIQNILGNSEITLRGNDDDIILPTDCVCVGSVPDEKNDVLYIFLTGADKDMIVEYNTKTKEAFVVVADIYEADSSLPICLNFDVNNIITGVNIIDGMLFWTDNNSEPKKINIQRCKAGNPNNKGDTPTKLVVRGVRTTVNLNESHITVIKKYPKYPPLLEYETIRDPLKNYTGVMQISDSMNNPTTPSSIISTSIGDEHDFSFLKVGDIFKTQIIEDIEGNKSFDLDWRKWMSVTIKEFDGTNAPSVPITNYTIRGKITDWEDNNFSNVFEPEIQESTLDNTNVSFSLNNGTWTYSSARKRFEYNPWDLTIAELDPNSTGYQTESTRIASLAASHSPNFALNPLLNGNGNEKIELKFDDTNPSSSALTKKISGNGKYRVDFKIQKIDPQVPLEGDIYIAIWDEDGEVLSSTSLAVTPNIFGASTGTGRYSAEFDMANATVSNRRKNTIVFESRFGYSDTQSAPNSLFLGSISEIKVTHLNSPNSAAVEIRVEAIDGIPPNTTSPNTSLKFAIDKFDTSEKLFEFKFPRFAYRYKYEDGEYSAFSPFTQPAFAAGNFDYHPKKGYNTGMVNNLKSLTIKQLNKLIPEDVVSIDILYKEENSPNIYIVDTIKDLNTSEYVITTEALKNGVLPQNQLIRPWDNVPKKALAQDIVGNRIVYGNYEQNYDLVDDITSSDYKINIDIDHNPEINNSRTGKKSIKSLREYQLGVVYTDKYGRETPVLTNSDSVVKVNKDQASYTNSFSVNILNEGRPVNMKYFKFYIKDNGGEYHNMAMDRYYDAEDDNIWLAFPSSDRNKVDIDDFLILKKGIGSVTSDKDLIKEKARYKVLDIKNEAPDFIKRKETLIGSKVHDSGGLFASSDLPSENDINFAINYNQIQNSSFANLHDTFSNDPDVEYHISLHNTDNNRVSDRYKVMQLDSDGTSQKWKFTLEKPFTNEINSFTNDESGLNSTLILDNTYLNIYRTAVDKSASHKFDGRFFVKIYNDDIFARTLKEKVDDTKKEFKSTGISRKMYSLTTFSGNRLKKHHNGTSREAFKDISLQVNNVGLHDKVSNNPTAHLWSEYYSKSTSFAKYLGTLNGEKRKNDGTNVVVNTRDADVFLDYDAYFRGINVNLNDNALHDRVDELNLEDTHANDDSFQDVWFVDKAISAGHFFHSTTTDSNIGWDTSPYTWYKNSMGVSNPGGGKGTLEVSFGGVQPVKWSENISGLDNDPSFFDLADSNVNYSEREADFIKNLAIGSQFRFKEDPDHTVYTIENVDIFLRVRYESLLNYSNHATAFDRNADNDHLRAIDLFPFHAKARSGKGSGWNTPNNNIVNANNVVGPFVPKGKYLASKISPTDGNTTYATSTYLRPSNYTKNWRLKLDKHIGNNWNPFDLSYKRVDITATPVSLTTTAAGSSNYIVTNSITSADGRQLSIGMVFYNCNSTALTKKAVVTKIERGAGGTANIYKIYLKTYDGTDDLSTSISNGVGSSQTCLFDYFTTNDLSPNSAKNLNFFRSGKGYNDTKDGTAAVGYTMEWIEEKTSRSEEEVLPKNPAIWETEPKPKEDIDIYYEASGSLPINISLEESDLSEHIPVGSIVEFERADNIPPGTTVKEIDGNNIILDKSVIMEIDPTNSIFQAIPTYNFTQLP